MCGDVRGHVASHFGPTPSHYHRPCLERGSTHPFRTNHSSVYARVCPQAVVSDMGSEHYCLRWNNHQNNLLGVFSQLLQEESLVDVTLACSEEGRLIRAHKVVLSACSAYFKALFIDHPTRHPIVVLKDVRFAELRGLVEFMYRGEVNVDHRQLSTLLKTAESLKVKGLADMARPSDDDDDDTVGGGHRGRGRGHVELVPAAGRDDEPMEPEDLRPSSRCRTPVPAAESSRTPSPPVTEGSDVDDVDEVDDVDDVDDDDNLSMQSEPSDMTTTAGRRDRPSSSPSGSGLLPPVQEVPLVSEFNKPDSAPPGTCVAQTRVTPIGARCYITVKHVRNSLELISCFVRENLLVSVFDRYENHLISSFGIGAI